MEFAASISPRCSDTRVTTSAQQTQASKQASERVTTTTNAAYVRRRHVRDLDRRRYRCAAQGPAVASRPTIERRVKRNEKQKYSSITCCGNYKSLQCCVGSRFNDSKCCKKGNKHAFKRDFTLSAHRYVFFFTLTKWFALCTAMKPTIMPNKESS